MTPAAASCFRFSQPPPSPEAKPGDQPISLLWTFAQGETPLELNALGFEVEFETETLCPGAIRSIDPQSGEIEGDLGSPDGLTFLVRWETTGHLLRKQIFISGHPEPRRGRLLRLLVFRGTLPGEKVDDTMGWRENPFEQVRAQERQPEEGSGRMPPCGYPVFFRNYFAGLEHPMGFTRLQDGVLELFHHPTWEEERTGKGASLASMKMVLGHVPRGQEVQTAFLDYLDTVRKPAPQQASVEINTFWTDPCSVNGKGEVEYSVDLTAYEAMARQWIGCVLEGEQGLISSFVLDAGWHDPKSLFLTKPEIGGPGDNGLAELARTLDQSGLSLGLWISLNGPVGIHPDWAAEAGYSVSGEGLGSAYSASKAARFVCLDDPRWERDFCARLDALNRNVPVAFYKGDWDNDGIISPTQKALLATSGQGDNVQALATIWEQNVNAMIRMYHHIAPRGSGIRVRGGWWLSPWWFMHVDCTHLPHSGDLEACSLPALTQRDATLTSRDMMVYEHMVRHRSPVPWDVIISHDFASAPRSPVFDTDESWVHNLVLWIARGGQAIQIYTPPYGVRGRRARALKQLLRWFRDHETLLWKSQTAMLGGDPGLGEIYGYRHRRAEGDQEVIVIRNPIGRPQAIPPALRAEISSRPFSILYPYRSTPAHPTPDPTDALQWLPSNGVLLLMATAVTEPMPEPTPNVSIPKLHAIPCASVGLEHASTDTEIWKVVVPYEYDAAEIILEFANPTAPETTTEVHAAVGRYPDGLSAAAVPVTWLHSFWKKSYTEKRTGRSPFRWERNIARVPVGPAGTSYLSLRKPFPAPLAIWLEARRTHEEDSREARLLPLPPEARFVLFHHDGPLHP